MQVQSDTIWMCCTTNSYTLSSTNLCARGCLNNCSIMFYLYTHMSTIRTVFHFYSGFIHSCACPFNQKPTGRWYYSQVFALHAVPETSIQMMCWHMRDSVLKCHSSGSKLAWLKTPLQRVAMYHWRCDSAPRVLLLNGVFVKRPWCVTHPLQAFIVWDIIA